MNRCIVIHPTGATELQDFHPALHQRLRGLGYKRFVIQLVRNVNKQLLSAAVYSRLTPSAWQASDSARKLWGRGPGAISIFDEQGETVLDGSDPALANAASGAWSETPPRAVRAAESLVVARAPTRTDPMEHRLRSLAHRWLYLVDRNDGDAAPFDELFADSFELDWSPARIRTREELSAWYRGVSERVLKSGHTLAELKYEGLEDGRYLVRLELQWYGFTRAQPDEELEARTLHEWSVADDPSDRFARIESAKIRVLVPAQPSAR
jgi:hypothetical protein